MANDKKKPNCDAPHVIEDDIFSGGKSDSEICSEHVLGNMNPKK